MLKHILAATSTLLLINTAFAKDIDTAAGVYRGYWLWNNQFAPLILNKTKNFYWNFNASVGMPTDYSSILEDRTDLSCTDDACLWVAKGMKNGDLNTHLLIMRNTNGANWSTVSMVANAPKEFSPEVINAVKCVNDSCYITGSYHSADGTLAPLFIRSDDDGKSWIFADMNSFFPNNQNQDSQQSMNDISCHDQYCVALGRSYDFNKGVYSNILLNSADKGVHWQASSNSNIADVGTIQTMQYKNGKFYLLTNQTASVGYTSAILASQDNGQTWMNMPINGLKSDASYILRTLDCNGMTCIAAGTMKKGSISRPFALISTNNGSSWDVSTNSISFTAESVGVEHLIATSKTWIMAGNAVQNNGMLTTPFMMMSKNQGLTWDNIDLSALLPSSIFNSLSTVNCVNDYCVADGFYYVQKSLSIPYILESLDGGETWTQSTISNLPNKMYAGRLLSAI